MLKRIVIFWRAVGKVVDWIVTGAIKQKYGLDDVVFTLQNKVNRQEKEIEALDKRLDFYKSEMWKYLNNVIGNERGNRKMIKALYRKFDLHVKGASDDHKVS